MFLFQIFKSGYGSVIAVRLYVLGIPKVTSAKVLHPIHTISLADAVKNIKTAIKSGKLKITFQQSGMFILSYFIISFRGFLVDLSTEDAYEQ